MKKARLETIELAKNKMATEEEIVQNMKHEIRDKVNSYYTYVTSSLNVENTIKTSPSEEYKKNPGGVNWLNIKKYNDPLYTSRMFDVLNWWHSFGRSQWKDLAYAAFIILGKPHHNGYQERVFSRGTFTDDNLRKRLKEDTFEMCVLESLNINIIEKYGIKVKERKNVQQEVQDFFTTRKIAYPKILNEEEETTCSWDEVDENLREKIGEEEDDNNELLEEDPIIEIVEGKKLGKRKQSEVHELTFTAEDDGNSDTTDSKKMEYEV